jgi:threonine synthase
MKFYSTNRQSSLASFREALFRGQAPDGGLFMPESLPAFSEEELQDFSRCSYTGLSLGISRKLFGLEIDDSSLLHIIGNAYHFAPVLKRLDDRTFCLELFHGPTLSFKDFGAQFMAQAMSHFASAQGEPITILVATSGDTGSAVAHAYYRLEGIRVALLYPSGKVSPLQEKQLTALGDNIHALEVQGTFDDCQALVKRAFSDALLQKQIRLSSANSINIGRLLPQSFYYFWGVLQILIEGFKEAVVCVPSGNFGNLTAGLFAQKMGLPIRQFVAAVNSNDVVIEYLSSGQYRPRSSVQTLSNAMDVGNPSNWARIRDLYQDDPRLIADHLWATSVDDRETIASMKSVYDQFGYVTDPHTAVGFQAIKRLRNRSAGAQEMPCIILSTAHPAKFGEIIYKALSVQVPLPVQLDALEKERYVTPIANDYEELKNLLLHLKS